MFSQFAGQELVWITLINDGYVDFTKNFLISMKLCATQFKLIVYCLDQASFDKITQLGFRRVCFPVKAVDTFLPKNHSITYTPNFTYWYQMQYKQIVFAKLDALKYTMQQMSPLGIKNVGFIDMDIWLFKDPTPFILKEVNNLQNADKAVFMQCDENNAKCTNRAVCANMCTGLIVFRNSNIDALNLFNYTANDIKTFSSDQEFLNLKFKKQHISTLTVDKSLFLNGASVPHLKKKKVGFSKESCLIHFNYMIGDAKRTAMKLQGLWRV